MSGRLEQIERNLDKERHYQQAREFCLRMGWRYLVAHMRIAVDGGNGTIDTIDLPEALAMFAEQIAAERDQWRKIAEDLHNTQLPQPRIIASK